MKPAKTEKQTGKTIGLIAGNGDFPFLFAAEARKNGHRILAVCLKEETDPALESVVDGSLWVNLGQLNKLIGYFRSHSISEAVMAGQVRHAQLFRGFVPDFRALKILTSVKNKTANSLLSAVAEELGAEGITVCSSLMFLENNTMKPGVLSKRKPSKAHVKDIEFGLRVAKGIAGFDIGQTVVVKDRVVIAVEAMEGTDAAILRSADLCGAHAAVIKVSKPGQDLRFDVPIIGPKTIENLKHIKADVLAFSAHQTLVLHPREVIRMADEYGLVLIACEEETQA